MIACHAIDSDSNSDLGVATIFVKFSLLFKDLFLFLGPLTGVFEYSAFFKKANMLLLSWPEVPDNMMYCPAF